MEDCNKPCCASAALRNTKHILVAGQQVGISQLDAIIEKASLLSDGSEDAVREELIRLAKIYNYIPTTAENAYEDALYEEFRKRKSAVNVEHKEYHGGR